MKPLSWVAAALLVAGPLTAQERVAVVSVYGGGADHLADLTTAGTASFAPGYSLGASLGLQLTEYLAVHADFTYTRTPAWGATPFAGHDVNRFFYGAHLEARYPFSNGFAPYAFGGLGAVTIDQLGIDTFDPVTRPAAEVGGGLFYTIRRTRLDVFGEVKGLTYRWNMAGFHRTMFDVTFGGGFSYRLPF